MSNTKKELVSGVFWSAIEKYSSLIISLVVSMILARLLSPEDYGVVAIAMVFIIFLHIFCSMGIAPAIIQNKELSKSDINNIFSFTIYIGLTLSCILFFASIPISRFYNNLLLLPICQILSIQVFFSTVNMVPNALMLKNKRFKDIARRTVVLQSVTGIVSIIAAFNGIGVYALLISPVFSAIGIFIWNLCFFPLKFIPLFSKNSVMKIFSYSAYQFMFEFVNYFSRNIDKLLIGKYLSVSALGYYEKSYRLMQMPLSSLTSVINPVLQPILSEFQNNLNEICRRYEKIIGFIALVSFPAGFFLFIAANEIIIILFGEQWIKAVLSFKILAISVPLQVILSTTGGVFQSCNATKNLFFVGLRNSLMTVAGFLVALVVSGTIEAVAWGWSATSFICFISSFYEFYYRIFNQTIKKLFIELCIPSLNVLILIILYSIFQQILPNGLYAIFIIKALFVMLVSISFYHLTGKISVIEIIQLIIKKK